jgi:hypothetical protein
MLTNTNKKEGTMKTFKLSKHQVKCLEAYAMAVQVSREEYVGYVNAKVGITKK